MTPAKVLVIEDTPSIVETVALALEMRWPQVKVVSTSRGEQGIVLVENESPDAVIIDLGLPDISGFQVLQRIRGFSDIPVLILTARSDEQDKVKGLECGADDYMTKPFRQLELQDRLNGILTTRHKKKSDQGE